MVYSGTINFEGEKGSSLCTKISFTSGEFKEFTERLAKYLEKYNKTSDDRAFAIIGALTVENELDKFLSIWIKGYKDLDKIKEFTFSFKVELAVSLKLIPAKIFNAIEPIRRIRNIFAHNFEIDTFEQAKEKDSKSDNPAFPMLVNKLKSFASNDTGSDKGNFHILIILIIIGLNVYSEQLVKIQEDIWESGNLK